VDSPAGVFAASSSTMAEQSTTVMSGPGFVAAEVCLQRLAGLSRADLHRAHGVVGDIPDGERGHEVISATLNA
jgi:hypothetical protein